jgi:flagellar hook protein FlgE
MSFQQGVTGLNAAGRNLDVIGNNVANASTVGAKTARAEFADIYSRAAGGAGNSVGAGVSLATVAQQFSQGNISSSDNPLDVAINGNGFFQLKDPNGVLQYSRNGQFKIDNKGFVVNDQGLKLLGHSIASGSMVPGAATPIQLPTAGIPPTPTSNVKLEINVDARSKQTFTGATPAIDINDDKTYNNATSLNVYDMKGQAVGLTYFFQKAATDTWNVYASANGVALNADGSGNPQPIATAVFPPDGGQPTSPLSPVLIDVPATGVGTAAATEPILGIKLDVTKLTQYGAVFGPTDVSQDGFPPGRLTSVAVQSNGTLMASYSSGQSEPIAKLELATFRNVQGLQPVGGNAWTASFTSGDPVLGEPGGGNLGLLSSQSLEESNVDLTSELVNMMVAQRIYQANAQTIKTQDSVMQTLVNLR